MTRTRRTERRGANAIEFALTFPVFIALMFGLIDFGAYFAGLAITDSITSQSCRSGALLDPLVEAPEAAAEEEMRNLVESMPFIQCNEGCSLEATIEGAAPSSHLVCKATVETQILTGMTPVPDLIGSSSMTRMEWQR